jgi:hypothetical protein
LLSPEALAAICTRLVRIDHNSTPAREAIKTIFIIDWKEYRRTRRLSKQYPDKRQSLGALSPKGQEVQ